MSHMLLIVDVGGGWQQPCVPGISKIGSRVTPSADFSLRADVIAKTFEEEMSSPLCVSTLLIGSTLKIANADVMEIFQRFVTKWHAYGTHHRKVERCGM